MEKITEDRWKEAQRAELDVHALSTNIDEAHRFLNFYFHFFEDSILDISGKKILEVGCGPYPLATFAGASKVVGVEPLYDNFTNEMKKYWEENNVTPFTKPFEDWESDEKFDEVWFINFLQHTLDPELCLEKSKKVAKKVRVFEPINTEINECHPHSLTMDLFKKHFPNTDIKLYAGGTITIFHLADCCYFVADNE